MYGTRCGAWRGDQVVCPFSSPGVLIQWRLMVSPSCKIAKSHKQIPLEPPITMILQP